MKAPNFCKRELDYALSVLLTDHIGIAYQTVEGESPVITLEAEGKQLELSAEFFSIASTEWLRPESLPKLPLPCLEIGRIPGLDSTGAASVPILYGSDAVHCTENKISLGADILGSAFFLLSRYEEMVCSDRDVHGRFPVTSSLSYQGHFLDRPLVLEYARILKACFRRLWPSILLPARKGSIRVSCDVDSPYSPYTRSLRATARQVGGDLLKRGSPSLALSTTMNTIASRRGNYSRDPFNSFEWMMDVNEKAGNRVHFFFIVDHSGGEIDGYYSMAEPRIRNLVRRIVERGHTVGIHFSYNSYLNGQQVAKEIVVFRQTLAELSVRQSRLVSRQHFLRWSTPTTSRLLSDAGVDCDSTMTYAEVPGFRTGTCIEYPLYDLENRIPLRMREHPLVLMETSVFSNKYLNMRTEGALNHMRNFKDVCLSNGGDFTLLWHNSRLFDERDRELYSDLIA